MKKLILVYVLLVNAAFAQDSIDGKWDGSITIKDTELRISVEFVSKSDGLHGTIDIPQQGAKGLALIHVSYDHKQIYFELPAGPGVAVFDGAVDSNLAAGTFTQGGVEGTFILKKSQGEKQEKKTDTLSYKQEEVTFSNGENTFAGTLTIPFAKGKHPAVVMITGSGAQNRDEELLGFKPFAVIADYFTRNGIAVLRYDDRGVGGSKGKPIDSSTTEDFAYDVIEAVKFLKTRDDINPDQIGLCGHSEGGIVAPLAATKYDGIAFIVLIAGTGVTGSEILLEQSRLIMKAEGASDEEIKTDTDLLKKAFEALKTDKGWDEVSEAIKKQVQEQYNKMTDEQKKSIKDKDNYIATTVELQIQQLQSPWFRYFVAYDAGKTLEKVKCPVLMLFGEKDLQVPVKQNQGPMEDALKRGGNQNFKTVVFPDANHLFLKAKTGSPSEYAALPKEFVPGFLDIMVNWILERVTVVKQ